MRVNRKTRKSIGNPEQMHDNGDITCGVASNLIKRFSQLIFNAISTIYLDTKKDSVRSCDGSQYYNYKSHPRRSSFPDLGDISTQAKPMRYLAQRMHRPHVPSARLFVYRTPNATAHHYCPYSVYNRSLLLKQHTGLCIQQWNKLLVSSLSALSGLYLSIFRNNRSIGAIVP